MSVTTAARCSILHFIHFAGRFTVLTLACPGFYEQWIIQPLHRHTTGLQVIFKHTQVNSVSFERRDDI